MGKVEVHYDVCSDAPDEELYDCMWASVPAEYASCPMHVINGKVNLYVSIPHEGDADMFLTFDRLQDVLIRKAAENGINPNCFDF